MNIPKQAYTTEFKEEAVRRVKDGQSVGKVHKELGLGDQTLRNWGDTGAAGFVARTLDPAWRTLVY